MHGPRAVEIALTDAERAQLQSWARRRTRAAGLAHVAGSCWPRRKAGRTPRSPARLGLARTTVNLAESVRGSTCTSPQTSSSWLNQVERWFAYLTEQLLRRGNHTSVHALEADIRAWVKAWNEAPGP